MDATYRVKVVILLAGCWFLLGCPAVQARWNTYENCTLLTDEFADGDSFHVKTRSRHYIFRLYFVDTPETDKRYPERITDQAAYWGIDEKDVLKLGKESGVFTRQLLAKGFTGYSRLAGARGNSDRERYYAMVKVGREFLGEALVRHGLARVYGRGVSLPDGTSQAKWWQHLRQLENQARRDGVGAWGLRKAAGRLKTTELLKQDVVLPRDVVVYSLEKGGSFLGRLKRGTRVKVLETISPTRVRILYQHDGTDHEVQCRKADLGL